MDKKGNSQPLAMKLPRPPAHFSAILWRLALIRWYSGCLIDEQVCLCWIYHLIISVLNTYNINLTLPVSLFAGKASYWRYKALPLSLSLTAVFFKGYFPCSASSRDISTVQQALGQVLTHGTHKIGVKRGKTSVKLQPFLSGFGLRLHFLVSSPKYDRRHPSRGGGIPVRRHAPYARAPPASSQNVN